LVLFGTIPDISSFTSAASTILAIVIALETYRAYEYTRKDYQLAFAVGFALLAASYALLVPLAFGIKLPTIGYATSDILNYPPRMVIQSVGFILVALAYSRTPRAKYFLYGLLALLGVLVVIVVIPQTPEIPYSVNALLYLLNLALICYVLYSMLEKTKPTDLVMIGFLLMALSQYTGIVDALQGSELTYFLVQLTRLLSLVVFFVAFLRLPVRRPIEIQPDRSSK
jgi:hypothetical protein